MRKTIRYWLIFSVAAVVAVVATGCAALCPASSHPSSAMKSHDAVCLALHWVEGENTDDPRPWDADDPDVAMVYALWRAETLRDADTGRHLDRTRTLAACLAEGLRERSGGENIPESFIRELYYAAALHDLGKIGIPDAVLLAPGRFTSEQKEIMDRHAGLGGDALRDIAARFPGNTLIARAAEAAQHHHERWDGGGGPAGLAGEAIPLSARIMAVADVYDALANARVYKPALPPEKCADMLREGSGTLFDPAVVAVFEEKEADFRRLQGLPPAASGPASATAR